MDKANLNRKIKPSLENMNKKKYIRRMHSPRMQRGTGNWKAVEGEGVGRFAGGKIRLPG
jgi:hypothetical protein